MIKFIENVEKEISVLTENPDQDEYENFLVNGKELNSEAQLVYEKNRLVLHFTHINKESMDFVKYNSFRNTIDMISDAIDNRTYDYDVIKKIIVHMELELGMSVLFSNTLNNMIENGIENMECYETLENISYEQLYEYYSLGKRRNR